MSDAEWQALARDLHAELDPHTRALRFATGAGTVRIVHNDTHTEPATVATLDFDEPLPAELEVRDMREEDFWELFGDPEITFDDPNFDDALLVRGKIFVARGLLNENVRRALLELHHAVSDLHLNERGLRVLVDGRPLSVARTAELVELLRELSRAMVGDDERRGPYR